MKNIKSLDAAIQKLNLENKNLKKELSSEVKVQVLDFWNSIFYLERDLYQLQQYSRRENIEISGIPDDVPDNALESIAITMLRKIGVRYLDASEISA